VRTQQIVYMVGVVWPTVMHSALELTISIIIWAKFRSSYRSGIPYRFGVIYLPRYKAVEARLVRSLSLYLVTFVLCWVWDVVDHIITTIYPGCDLYWLWILQDLFSPLQGFLNFIVYGVANQLFSCNYSKKKDDVVHEREIQNLIN